MRVGYHVDGGGEFAADPHHAASEAQAMTLAGDDWRQMTPRPCTVSAGFPR